MNGLSACCRGCGRVESAAGPRSDDTAEAWGRSLAAFVGRLKGLGWVHRDGVRFCPDCTRPGLAEGSAPRNASPGRQGSP